MEFRKAQMKDMDEILGIYKRAIQSMKAQGIDQWDEAYPNGEDIGGDIAKEEMVLGELNGRIVSCHTLNHSFDEEYEGAPWQYPGEAFLVLHRLCVDPLAQGRGIGRQAVQQAERQARKAGASCIRLDAFSKNPHALRMYEGLSYKKIGEVLFRKGVFYLYEKRL